MYDVVLSKKEKYFEAKSFTPGTKIKTFKLPWGKIGLSICYDLRFPNLYRKLSKAGSLFLTVPSAFTETTGRKHWHTLLKARAIENQAYVVGVNRYGKDGNGFYHSGNSAIHSPLGETLISIDDKEDIETLVLDKEALLSTRKQFPFYKDADKFKLL